jgi:hypothetical protein
MALSLAGMMEGDVRGLYLPTPVTDHLANLSVSSSKAHKIDVYVERKLERFFMSDGRGRKHRCNLFF